MERADDAAPEAPPSAVEHVATTGRLTGGALAAALAVVGGLLLGGATSFAQGMLPRDLTSFANSAGGWTMFAFLLVWLGRARPLLAAVLGATTFEALVEGYGLVSGWRGFVYQRPFSGVFNLVGLLAGPVVGVSAALTRHFTGRWRAVAVAPLSAVLLGEGLYGLLIVGESTSPVYWSIQILLGVLFLALNALRSRATCPWIWLGALLTLVGAALFFLTYAEL